MSGVAEEINLDALLKEMLGAVRAMMSDPRATGVQENRPLRVMLRRYARKFDTGALAAGEDSSASDTDGGTRNSSAWEQEGMVKSRRRTGGGAGGGGGGNVSPSKAGRFEKQSFRRRSINLSEKASAHQLSSASAKAIFLESPSSSSSAFVAGSPGRRPLSARARTPASKTTSSDTESGIDAELQEDERYRLVDPGLQRIALVGGEAGMYFEQLQLLRYCFLSPSKGRFETRPGEGVLRGVPRNLFLDFFAPLLTRTNERGPNDSIAAMLDVDSTGVIPWSSLVKVLVNRGKLSDASREPYSLGAPAGSQHKAMISSVCIPSVGCAKGRSTSAWKFEGQSVASSRGTDGHDDERDPELRASKKQIFGSAWTRLPASLNTIFFTGGLDGIVREWSYNLAPTGGFFPGSEVAVCNTIVHHRSCHAYYAGADLSVSMRTSPYSINDMAYLQSSKLLVAQSFGHVYSYVVKDTEDLTGRRVLHSVLRTENFHRRVTKTDSWVVVDAAREHEEELQRKAEAAARNAGSDDDDDNDDTPSTNNRSRDNYDDDEDRYGNEDERRRTKKRFAMPSTPASVPAPPSSSSFSSPFSRPGSNSSSGSSFIGGGVVGARSRPVSGGASASRITGVAPAAAYNRFKKQRGSETLFRRVIVSEKKPKAPPEEASASFCVVPGESPIPASILTLREAHGDITSLCGLLHLRGFSDSTLHDSFVCGTNEGEVLLYSLSKGTEARTTLDPSWRWNMLQGGLVFSISEVPTSEALLIVGLDQKGANFIDVVDIEKNVAKLRFLGGALCGTSLRAAGGATGSVIEKLLDTRLPAPWRSNKQRLSVLSQHLVLNVDEFGTSYTRAEYDADRGLLIASGLGKTCALYSDSLPEPIHKLEDHAAPVVGASFNLSRYRMLVMTADKTLHVYDSRMNRKIQSEIDFSLRSPVDGYSTAAFDKNAQLAIGCSSVPVLFTPSIRADANAAASGAGGAIGKAVGGGIHVVNKAASSGSSGGFASSPERKRAQLLRQLSTGRIKSSAAGAGTALLNANAIDDDHEAAQTRLMAAVSCTAGGYIAVCMGNVAGAISVAEIDRDNGDGDASSSGNNKKKRNSGNSARASINLESVSRALVAVSKEPNMLFSAQSITDRCSHIAIETPSARRIAVCVNAEIVYLVNTLTSVALYTVSFGSNNAASGFKRQQRKGAADSTTTASSSSTAGNHKEEEVSCVVLTEAFVNTMALSGTAGAMSAAAAAANPQSSSKRSILCVGGSQGQLIVTLCDPPVALNLDGTPQTPEDEYDPHLHISGTGPPAVGSRSIVVHRRVVRPMHHFPSTFHQQQQRHERSSSSSIAEEQQAVIEVTKGIRSSAIVSVVGGMSHAHSSSLLVSTAAGDVYLVNFAQNQLGSSASMRRILCYDSIVASFPTSALRENFHVAFANAIMTTNSSSSPTNSPARRNNNNNDTNTSDPFASTTALHSPGAGDIASLCDAGDSLLDAPLDMTATFSASRSGNNDNSSEKAAAARQQASLRSFQAQAAARAHGRNKEDELLDELAGGPRRPNNNNNNNSSAAAGGGSHHHHQHQQHRTGASGNGMGSREADEILASRTPVVRNLWTQSTLLASRQIESLVVLAPHSYVAVLFGDGTITICFLSRLRVLPQVSFKTTRRGVFARSMLYYSAEQTLCIGDAAGNITFFDLAQFWVAAKEILEGVGLSASMSASFMMSSSASGADLKRQAEEKEQSQKQREEEENEKVRIQAEQQKKKQLDELAKSTLAAQNQQLNNRVSGGKSTFVGSMLGKSARLGRSFNKSAPAESAAGATTADAEEQMESTLSDSMNGNNKPTPLIELMKGSGSPGSAESPLATPSRHTVSHFASSPGSASFCRRRNQQPSTNQFDANNNGDFDTRFPIQMLGSVLIAKDTSINTLELFRGHLCVVGLISSSAVVIIDLDRICASARRNVNTTLRGAATSGGGGGSPTASLDFVRTSLVIGDVSLFTDDERSLLRSSYGLPQHSGSSGSAEKLLGAGAGATSSGLFGGSVSVPEDEKLLEQLERRHGGGRHLPSHHADSGNSPSSSPSTAGMGPMTALHAPRGTNVDATRGMSIKSHAHYKGLLKEELVHAERRLMVAEALGTTAAGASTTAAALVGDAVGAAGGGEFTYRGQQRNDDSLVIPSSGVLRKSDFTVAMVEQQKQQKQHQGVVIAAAAAATSRRPTQVNFVTTSEQQQRQQKQGGGKGGNKENSDTSAYKNHMPSPTWDLEFTAASEPPAYLLASDPDQQIAIFTAMMNSASAGTNADLGATTTMCNASSFGAATMTMMSASATSPVGNDKSINAALAFAAMSSASRRQQLKMFELQRRSLHPFFTHRANGGEATFEDRVRLSSAAAAVQDRQPQQQQQQQQQRRSPIQQRTMNKLSGIFPSLLDLKSPLQQQQQQQPAAFPRRFSASSTAANVLIVSSIGGRTQRPSPGRMQENDRDDDDDNNGEQEQQQQHFRQEIEPTAEQKRQERFSTPPRRSSTPNRNSAGGMTTPPPLVPSSSAPTPDADFTSTLPSQVTPPATSSSSVRSSAIVIIERQQQQEPGEQNASDEQQQAPPLLQRTGGMRSFRAAVRATAVAARTLSSTSASNASSALRQQQRPQSSSGSSAPRGFNPSASGADLAASFRTGRWGMTTEAAVDFVDNPNNDDDDDMRQNQRHMMLQPKHSVRYPQSLQQQQRIALIPNRNMGCPPDSTLDYHGIDADDDDHIIPGTFSEKNAFQELVKDNTMERLKHRMSSSGGGPFSNRLLVDPKKIQKGATASSARVGAGSGKDNNSRGGGGAPPQHANYHTTGLLQNPHLRRESLVNDVPNVPSVEANARSQEKILRLLLTTPTDSNEGATEPAPSRLSSSAMMSEQQHHRGHQEMDQRAASFMASLPVRPDSQQQQHRNSPVENNNNNNNNKNRSPPETRTQPQQQPHAATVHLSGRFPVTREQVLSEFASEELDEETVRSRLRRLYVSSRGFTPDRGGRQLAADGIVTSTGDVAEEVAARLLHAFGPAPTRPKLSPNSRRNRGASMTIGDRQDELRSGAAVAAGAASATAAGSAGVGKYMPRAPATARRPQSAASSLAASSGNTAGGANSARFGSKSFARELAVSKQHLESFPTNNFSAKLAREQEPQQQQQQQPAASQYKPMRVRPTSSRALSSPPRIIYHSPVRPRNVGDDYVRSIAKGAPPSYLESEQEAAAHARALQRQEPIFVESKYAPKIGTEIWKEQSRALNLAVEDATESQIKIQRALRRRQIVREAHGEKGADGGGGGDHEKMFVFRTLKRERIEREQRPLLPPKRDVAATENASTGGVEPISLWRAKRALKDNREQERRG